MDQDLQKRIEEAKAAGYSDEEIAKALGTAPPPPQATLPSGITVPILSAEEKAQFNQSEQRTRNRNSSENRRIVCKYIFIILSPFSRQSF